MKKNDLLYKFIKRVFDIVCAIIGIILLIPITLFTKIAYMCTGDFHKIFYTQNRIGYHGKEFKLFKLRSMVVGADKILAELLDRNPKLAREYKLNKKLENDPRITPVGKFLRKTSLDEFPQFINVLIGDMSVIGNRPYLPIEKQDMGKEFEVIESTKCGIVSLWGVSGRSEVKFDDRLALERYYSENQSFKLDCKIFFKVFKVLLFRQGAK